jgi:hypothetical protein
MLQIKLNVKIMASYMQLYPTKALISYMLPLSKTQTKLAV